MDADFSGVDLAAHDFSGYDDVPVHALRRAVRKLVTKYLNVPKDVPTDDGYLPDYTGLAEIIGFQNIDIDNFALQSNPTEALLSEWQSMPEATVGKLCMILRSLERFDILTDIRKWLESDVEVYREKRMEWEDLKKPLQDNTVTEGKAELDDHAVNQYRYMVTEDTYSATPVYFDAFVCYSGEDIDFVKEAIRQLENPPHNIRLCIADRDLLPGGADHSLSAKLIEDRCRRMLVILSESYLKSPQCDFQTKFAHALAPGSRSKKVIPVLIESCTIPNILRFVTLCDYTKLDLCEWFWNRLAAAIKSPLDPKTVEWSDHSLSSIVIDLPRENVKWDKFSSRTDTTTLDSFSSTSPMSSFSESSTASCPSSSSSAMSAAAATNCFTVIPYPGNVLERDHSPASTPIGSPKASARKTTISSMKKFFKSSSKC